MVAGQRQSDDLELLVVLARGPSLERVCVCFCTSAHKTGCQSMFTRVCLCGLQPSVKQWQAILHPSALSLSWCYTELGQASKTGCESMLLLTGSHKHVVASSFTCFSLYIFVCARLVPFLVLHQVIGQASKTGCESMLLLTGSHTCGSKQLYMF